MILSSSKNVFVDCHIMNLLRVLLKELAAYICNWKPLIVHITIQIYMNSLWHRAPAPSLAYSSGEESSCERHMAWWGFSFGRCLVGLNHGDTHFKRENAWLRK